MKILSLAVFLGFSAFLFGESAKDINAVLFLTKKDDFHSAFLQINGLQKGLAKGEKADIRLVMGGDSVLIFEDENLKELKEKTQMLTKLPNVKVVACSGAMKRANVDKSKLPKGIESVKAAPREVVELQLNGFALLIP